MGSRKEITAKPVSQTEWALFEQFAYKKSGNKPNFENKFKTIFLIQPFMKIKQHLGFISMLAIAFTACQQKTSAETDNFLENEIKNIEAQHTLQN